MGFAGSRWVRCSWRARTLVLGAMMLVGVFSACSGRPDAEVQEVSVQNDGASLVLQVNTCNEDSTSVSVVESDTEIVVTASTRARFGCSGGGGCSDPRRVELDEHLDDRSILDADGNEVRRIDPKLSQAVATLSSAVQNAQESAALGLGLIDTRWPCGAVRDLMDGPSSAH